MKTITSDKIVKVVADLCIRANLVLRPDVLAVLKKANAAEKSRKAKVILNAIINNAAVAAKEKIAICQDTGLPSVFVEIGQDVKVSGDFKAAINRGVELGYKRGALRNSIVADAIKRGASKFTPVVIHTDIVKGGKIKITVLPKGFGCENKTQLKMFKPTASIEEIKKFIVEVVKLAGPDACPPYVVGVGIGGTADYAMLLAKKSLLKNISILDTQYSTRKLELSLLKDINKLNIGPMGLGGKTTCLGVNVEMFPTHIAGLPVAVNISCHALRSASAVL